MPVQSVQPVQSLQAELNRVSVSSGEGRSWSKMLVGLGLFWLVLILVGDYVEVISMFLLDVMILVWFHLEF